MFNVVEECEDIYIEIRSLGGELQMTIDAKTIIPKLSVSLQKGVSRKEWKKLKNMGSIN